MNIVVTGGAGYIGSYVCRALLESGHKVLVIDDLSTGKQDNLPESVDFFAGDFTDEKIWRQLFGQKVDVVIHLAGKIDATESVQQPELYIKENVDKTQQLLKILLASGVEGIIFASSAAVYGDAEKIPTPETSGLYPINPYGESKVLAEGALQEFASGVKKAVSLRFFNVAGTLPQVLIRPRLEAALISAIKKSLDNPQFILKVYGNNYQTIDGTCERDFVHVADIAAGFVAVINKWNQLSGFEAINIGTGQSHSVMEVIRKTEVITGRKINYQVAGPRAGEIVTSVADNTKMKQLLNLELSYSDLETIIKSSL